MAQHFLNMRFRFPPTDGYAHLRALAASFGDESTFVRRRVASAFVELAKAALILPRCRGD